YLRYKTFMQHYTDIILYKTHQHFIVVIFRFLAVFLPYALGVFILGKYLLSWSIALQGVLILLGAGCIFGWYYFFWIKSYFIISNEKIIVKVRNGLFSKFHMSIHYKNIRDTAFSKNNILHYALGYGTLFARSSAGAVGDLEARNIPHIEKVYKIINALHNFTDEERKNITNLEQVTQPLSFSKGENSSVDSKEEKTIQETLTEATQKEKQILLSIQGIKEVIEITDTDRRYIFENEEDKNHGVYETLRRQVVFAVTHDSTFRQPDEAIVMKAGEKVIFPVIEFHEIKRKKVSSSSPGMQVHEYLVPKFKNLGDYDATLLIGFDI
ncbi:PH domain-containing protein, partial [Candidatus Gracilibacteria bacterium]|nr:PH domain-containing protein [Candidatus Gracilibacteria bacterium]